MSLTENCLPPPSKESNSNYIQNTLSTNLYTVFYISSLKPFGKCYSLFPGLSKIALPFEHASGWLHV